MKLFIRLVQSIRKRKFKFHLIFISLLLVVLYQFPTATTIYAASNVYYVAKNGSDSNPGTAAAPWLTIQKAANTMVAGDIVYIKAGTYSEKITPKNSGKSGSTITYQNYTNDSVIIDGTGVSTGGTGLLNIQSKNYITLKGLEIQDADYMGIWILGPADHITIQDSTVHNTVNAGLYAIGELTITNIVIDNCIFYNTNSTASNEMVTLSGANGFEIKDCTVYEPLTPRIGIDLKHGCINGSVHDCEVYGCTSNPGIYIDARNDNSSNIDIYNNITHGNAYGIDLSDENGGATLSDINIYNNLIYNNYLCGFILPLGYGSETYNFTFINNTLYSNATSSNSEIKIIPSSTYLSKCTIRNNIIYGTKSGIYAIYYSDYANGGITIDHNLFYNSSGSWSSSSKFGTSSVSGNPLFVNAPANFNIQNSSPAKETGSSTSAPLVDFYGTSRPQGSGFDIGAYEVTSNNTAPVLANIGNKSVSEGQTLSFTITGTDAESDTLTYSAANLPSGASFATSSHTFTWTPTSGQAGEYTGVHFAVYDGNLSDSEDITITVNAVSSTNQAPVFTAVDDKTVNEAITLTFTVTATDADSDSLTYSASNLPSGATFTPSSRTFSWTPTYNQAGSYTAVQFTVSDGTATDSESISITVNNVNRTPILGSIGNKSANEGSTLTFTISATDADGNTLTYSASNLPSGASFTPSTRMFTWTPSYDQSGTHSGVHFIVSDGITTDTEDITITVKNVNRRPIKTNTGNKTVKELSTLTFTVSATDPDDDTLTYTVTNLPSGATFNSTTQTFSWTPTTGQAGDYTNVLFEVSDGSLSDSEEITITVTSEEEEADSGSSGGGGSSNESENEELTIPVELEGLTSTGTVELNSSGQMKKQETLIAENDTCIINIASGTFLLDNTGKPVKSLSISKPDAIPDPPLDKVINTIYEFGPSGTKFTPSVNLIVKYDPNTLSDGINPDELSIGTWNGSKWEILDSKVNSSNNTISTSLPHFSIYAVLAPVPVTTIKTIQAEELAATDTQTTSLHTEPDIYISQVQVLPPEVVVNQTMAIVALVQNYGNITDDYNVVFSINNAIIHTKQIQLAANSSQKVSFSKTFDNPGVYDLQVNNLSISINVKAAVVEYAENNILPLEGTHDTLQPSDTSSKGEVSLSLLAKVIGGACVIIVITGFIIFFLRRKIFYSRNYRNSRGILKE